MDKSTKLPSTPGLSLRVATTNIEIILQKTSSLVAQIATGAKQIQAFLLLTVTKCQRPYIKKKSYMGLIGFLKKTYDIELVIN